MARERPHDARTERGRHGQRGCRSPVRRQLPRHRSFAARLGIPDPPGREQPLFDAGRRPAPHRARPPRKPAVARRPDCRHTGADAFEPPRHPQRRILADAILLCHQRGTLGPLSVDHAERDVGMDEQQRGPDRRSREIPLVGRSIASCNPSSMPTPTAPA